MDHIVTNHRDNTRTVYGESGRAVSVGRNSPSSRVARLLLAAAALRRTNHCGDLVNARALVKQARALRA